jgi:rare lipoprotein A
VKSALLLAAFTVLALALCATVPAFGAETMRASYYGSESGNRTASGERFHPNGMTAAHRSLPFGTRLRVCYRGCVVVRVTDRGPFIRGRSLDLSAGAARVIGLTKVGVANVEVSSVR